MAHTLSQQRAMQNNTLTALSALLADMLPGRMPFDVFYTLVNRVHWFLPPYACMYYLCTSKLVIDTAYDGEGLFGVT